MMNGRTEDRQQVDDILAKELTRMTLNERELVYEEIHGVDETLEETPEFVARSLQAMEIALVKIMEKPAYEQAKRINSDYVIDPKFRLVFLRAEYFDPKLAALRMVRFFAAKLKYFGIDSLARSVRFSDLDKDDQAAVQTGHIQFLPSRDRAGRIVLCDSHIMFPPSYKSCRNLIKYFIYMILCAAEDEASQRRGMVNLTYQIGKMQQTDPAFYAEVAPTTHWLPIKLAAVHLCMDHPIMVTFARIVLGTANRKFRSRFRFHEGSHTECQYSLVTFGIPIDLFPISSEGELKLTSHNKWLKKRQIKDAAMTRLGRFDKIDLPGRNDVMLGRGKPFQRHQGNIILRSVVEQHLEAYNQSAKGTKVRVAHKVWRGIRGRFLKKGIDGWWVEVSDDEAREKVIKTFFSMQHKAGLKPAVETSWMAANGNKEGNNKRLRILEHKGGECFGFCR